MSQATQKNDMDNYITPCFIYSLYKERRQYFFYKKQPLSVSVKNLIKLYENRWIAINIKSFRTFTQEIVYYKKMLPPVCGIHSLSLKLLKEPLLIAMIYRSIKTFFLYQMKVQIPHYTIKPNYASWFFVVSLLLLSNLYAYQRKLLFEIIMISFVKWLKIKRWEIHMERKRFPQQNCTIQLILTYIRRTEKAFDSPYIVLLKELINSE